MGLEDLTTYTETDEFGDYTITTNRIVIDTIDSGANSHLVKDFGASFFSGDYSHLVTVEHDGLHLTSTMGPWLSTVSGHIQDCVDAGGFGLGIEFFGFSGVARYYLSEVNGTSHQVGDNIPLAINTTYYATIARDESVGSFGELKISMFSDADRTTEVSGSPITLTIAVQKSDFRYSIAASAMGTGSSNDISGQIDDLDLQIPAGGDAMPMAVQHYTQQGIA